MGRCAVYILHVYRERNASPITGEATVRVFLAGISQEKYWAGSPSLSRLAEGVGFEPTLGLLLSLISSQVPSTTQPPFRLLELIGSTRDFAIGTFGFSILLA